MIESPGRAREIAILRALVSLAEQDPTRPRDGRLADALHALRGYRWSDEENRIVYECLRGAAHKTAAPLRKDMAAEAVRMGHPDVEWSLYFCPPSIQFDVLEAVRNLDNTH